MKKYLKYLSFLAIILCYSITKVKADTTRINIDYSITNTTANTYMEEIKQYFQQENEYNNKIMISLANCNINNANVSTFGAPSCMATIGSQTYVTLNTPVINIIVNTYYNGYTSKIDSYYINIYKNRYSSTRQEIAFMYTPYITGQNTGAIYGLKVAVNEYETYKTQIQQWLYNQAHRYSGSDGSTPDGFSFVSQSDVEITGMETTQFMGYIYYSDFDLYYIGSKMTNYNETREITTFCNQATNDSNELTNFVTYETGISSQTLTCGDTIETYVEQQNNVPQYNEKINYYHSGEVKSIDMYFLRNITNNKYKITIESEVFNQNTFTPTNYKFYGKKCNNQTCYWEEVNNNSNVSNQTYTYDTNKIIIDFDLTIDTSNYYEIKLGIETKAKMFDLKIEDIQNENFTFDFNEVGIEYNIEVYDTLNEIKAIYINSKSQDINYRFYLKNDREYAYQYFYKFIKENNIVESGISTTNFKVSYFENNNNEQLPGLMLGSLDNMGELYIETGLIELGPNKPNVLYIYMEDEQGTLQDNYVYYNDQVYYTYTNNFTFNINYGNTNETINYEVNNQFLNNQFNNANKVDFSTINEIVQEYEQYKEQWLDIFYSFYEPLPQIVKHIFIILYFTMLAYGIFLIYKD